MISPNIKEYQPDSAEYYVTQEMVAVGVFHGEKYDSTNPDAPIVGEAPNACMESQNGNSDCIPCKAWNDDGECIEVAIGASTFTNNSGAGLPTAYQEGLALDDGSQPEGPGWRAVNCSFNADGTPRGYIQTIIENEEYPGMMIGIAGASTGLFGDEEFVSDLYGICKYGKLH